MESYYKYADHLGNKFRHLHDMLNFWSISRDIYKRREKDKIKFDTLEKILTTKVRVYTKKDNPRVDHKGREFRSYVEMCSNWNKLHGTVSNRLKRGWTLQEALEAPSPKFKPKRLQNVIADNNERYRTIKEMLIAKEISPDVFKIHSNVRESEFNSAPVKEVDYSNVIKDIFIINIKVNGYKTCRVSKAVKHLLNLKEDLIDTTEVIEKYISRKSRKEPIICYGIKYESMDAFANYLKVDRQAVKLRLNFNEETAEQIHDRFVCDIEFDGIKFTRLGEIAKYFDINVKDITVKRDKGVPLPEILELFKINKLKELSSYD